MESEKNKKIFEAIKQDDIKLFSSLIQSKNDLSICYGRFPILSLCYLYKSYAILNQYEDSLLTIKLYNNVEENYEMYLELKKYAKKSLRLYINDDIVAPAEMLAIIDDRKLIAKNYKKYQNNDKNIEKIRKIYSITHSTDIVIDKNNFIAPHKKKVFESKLLTSLIAVFLCFMIIFPTFSILVVNLKNGLGTFNSPIAINNETDFVSALNKGKMSYILKDDLYLDENINFKSFNGSIDGNNKTIYLDYDLTKPLFDNFTGTLKNLKIVFSFGKVNVSDNLAIIANNLNGKIDKCTISGTISGEFTNIDDSYFSLFVYNNQSDGIIQNSQIDVSANFTNSSSKNAFFVAFAGKNDGKIVNCTSISTDSSNEFIFDTVDVSCFAGENNGIIDNCVNNVSISQTSDKEWNPNTVGIAINNYGSIINSINNGDIYSSSTNEIDLEDSDSNYVVYSSGIAIKNDGTIKGCVNNGKIVANSIIACSYSAGIVIVNDYSIDSSINNGNIESYSQKFEIFIAGITCINYFTSEKSPEGAYNILKKISTLSNCKNTGNLKAKESENVDKEIRIYAGGISAFNYTSISGSANTGNILCEGNSSKIYAGGVVGYSKNISEYLNCSINLCDASGTISLESNIVSGGGVIGSSNYLTITNSKSTCNLIVSALEVSAGGISGEDRQSTIKNVSFNGNIKCSAKRLKSGGLIGNSQASTLDSCYVYSKITKSDYVDKAETSSEDTSSYYYIGKIVGYYTYNTFTQNVIDCKNVGYVSDNSKTLLWFFNSYTLSSPNEVTDFSGFIAYDSFEEMEDYYKSLES